MKKLMYMGAGVIVGGLMVVLMYNSKPITKKIRMCKGNVISTLDDCMDDLALLVEEIDEEKIKQRLKNKYNYYKRKLEKIDLDNLEENMKEMVSNLVDEIRGLINQTKEQIDSNSQ